MWVVECRKVVEFGLYFKGGTAGIHDILDMGCEKMREFKEYSLFYAEKIRTVSVLLREQLS